MGMDFAEVFKIVHFIFHQTEFLGKFYFTPVFWQTYFSINVYIPGLGIFELMFQGFKIIIYVIIINNDKNHHIIIVVI